MSEIPLIASHPHRVKPGQQRLLLRMLLKVKPRSSCQTPGGELQRMNNSEKILGVCMPEPQTALKIGAVRGGTHVRGPLPPICPPGVPTPVLAYGHSLRAALSHF